MIEFARFYFSENAVDDNIPEEFDEGNTDWLYFLCFEEKKLTQHFLASR